MSTEIRSKLHELPRLPKPELLALWQELFAKPAHPRLRRNLMIPILAYRIQENAYGGLTPSRRQSLQKLAANLEQDRKAPLCSHHSLSPARSCSDNGRGRCTRFWLPTRGSSIEENGMRACPRSPARSPARAG